MTDKIQVVKFDQGSAQAVLDRHESASGHDSAEPLRVRVVDPDLVSKYARRMSEGRWYFNAASICITPEGFVIDGLHRLQAVAKLEKISVPFLVIEDPSLVQSLDH